MNIVQPLRQSRPALLWIALVVVTGAVWAVPVLSQKGEAASERVVVYVQSFDIEKRVQRDQGEPSSVLCNQLFPDKRLDVMCESDMAAMLELASFQSVMGQVERKDGSEPKMRPVAKRMGEVEVIVESSIIKGKHGLILDVLVAERDPAFDGEVLKPGREHGRIRIKGIQGGIEGVTMRMERIGKRVAALALAGPKQTTPAE